MTRLIQRLHLPVLLIGAAAAAAATVLLFKPGLRHDYSLEAFVAADNAVYREFAGFMKEFPSNEFAVVAVQSDDALSPRCTKIVGDIVGQARELAAVERVTSIVDLPPFLRSELTSHPLVIDNLLSRDHRTTAALFQMKQQADVGELRRETVHALRRIVEQARAAAPDVKIVLAGPYVTHIDMHEFLHRDLINFSVFAGLLMMASLVVVFRRWGPVAVSMGVAASATVITLGLAVVLRLSTTMVTQMIVILTPILTVALCIHLIVGAAEARRDQPGCPVGHCVSRVLRMKFAPALGCIVTTAAGFASVCVSSLAPIRLFGGLMVFGLLLAMILSTALIPLMCRFKSIEPDRSRTSRLSLGLILDRVAIWGDRHRRTVVAGFALLTVACAAGIPTLTFESDFLKNFRAGSNVRRSYEFIESNLSPVGSMEVVIRTGDGSDIVTPNFLKQIDELGQSFVAKHEPIRKAMTLADLVKVGGNLPASALMLRLQLELTERLVGTGMVRNFLNEDRTAVRINLRAAEGYPVGEKLRIAREIENQTSQALGSEYQVRVTGLYYFYAEMIAGLLGDQYTSFAIALAAVFISLVVSMKSLRVGLILLVPNLFPMVFCLGFMAWARIPMNMASVMMLSISLGIAIDNTIHYAWRFRHELHRGGHGRAAMMRTHRSVGKACVYTTVVITGGFWILALSEFLPTAYFGMLIGLTMLAALAASLLLLPVMLTGLHAFGRHRKTPEMVLQQA